MIFFTHPLVAFGVRLQYLLYTGPVIVTYDTSFASLFSIISNFLPTSQWFANLDGIKEDALSAFKTVLFYPHKKKINDLPHCGYGAHNQVL